MQADLPMYEGVEDALRAAVQALGGSKKVGPMLWPDKGIDAASRLLLDCLNPLRAERLDPSQTIFILRAARDAGCYAPFQWFAAECGFDARPVTREQEVDRATAAVENAAKALQIGLATLEADAAGEGRRMRPDPEFIVDHGWRTPAKRAVIALYRHGLLPMRVVQWAFDRFRLRDA